jgi:hypothetical protein
MGSGLAPAKLSGAGGGSSTCIVGSCDREPKVAAIVASV